jgi:hypothetical protein
MGNQAALTVVTSAEGKARQPSFSFSLRLNNLAADKDLERLVCQFSVSPETKSEHDGQHHAQA